MKLIKKQIKMLSKDATRLPVLMTANIAGGIDTHNGGGGNAGQTMRTTALAAAEEIKNSAESICTA
ncbi:MULTISPECIES: hypothetical protein [unclassified Pseudoalteromonas]|uniref:hypothetical protein n=1 Tax=unclassified Pseudoalteromonas TaxID=194690 RepID=UPI002097664E|nr:hypothetical protein [Pseudoalteromonas sp. XMcav2-N]MCO7186911.1 hypothetical protein [Pseudoalteromonas sp. XMcav2-N]